MLATRPDFEVYAVFKLFEEDNKNFVTQYDADFTLKKLGYRPNYHSIGLFFKHYCKITPNKLYFSDFSELLTPKHVEYA